MDKHSRTPKTISQRRQIMQPWPLCLISSSKSTERAVHPRYYTWLPNLSKSSTSSSNISEDCSSNTTLLTNVSPFNSQQALISNKKNKQPTITKNNKNTNKNLPAATHYYAENLRHENGLKHSQLFTSDNKNTTIVDLKQLEPLVMDDPIALEEGDILMGVRDDNDDEDSPIKLKECSNGLPQPNFIQYNVPEKTVINRTNSSLIYQIVAALAVSLGSLVVGFSSGYTSPAIPSMNSDNAKALGYISPDTASWIGSALPLSALIGGITGGPLIEYFGRRNTILMTAVPFVAAGIVIGIATEVWIVILGRVIGGFGVGVSSLALPVYLGEAIQAEVRGTLGLLPTALGNIGILVVTVAGRYLNWSNLAFFGACLPIPFILLTFIIPETPRWYVSKGQTKRARKSLQWLRGKNVDVSEELASVEKMHLESEKNSLSNPVRELFKSENLRPLCISLGLMFFQQLSGINAVIFYAGEIFKKDGGDNSLGPIYLGIVNFISTFVATALIDRLGRKVLLYISSVAMIITLGVLGLYFYLAKIYDVSSFSWVILLSLIVYVVGFSLGYGPVPWLMMGEILPAKIRGPAASIATAFNWLCTFIVTNTFLSIQAALGDATVYWLYGAICIVSLVFVIVSVPETSGSSLEEIERRMKGPVRRMSAVANMKPMPTAC